MPFSKALHAPGRASHHVGIERALHVRKFLHEEKGVARSDAGCCNLVLLDGSLYCNGNLFSCFAVLVVSACKIMEARSGEDVMSRLG